MSIEDRVRAATRARTDLVRDIRPLALPDERPVRAPRPRRAPRRWLTWGAPIGAAALVMALALVLVMLRQAGGPPPGPATPAGAPPVSESIPRYYVTLAYTGSTTAQMKAVVGDDQTGRTLAVLNPSASQNFYGVTAAADDRTFVVINYSAAQHETTWYLLRLTPGAAHPAQLTKLPIKPLAAQVSGLALSPGGSELAVMWRTATTPTNAVTQLSIYSMSSGAVLDNWRTPGPENDILGEGANGVDLTWVNNDRSIDFEWDDIVLRTVNVRNNGTTKRVRADVSEPTLRALDVTAAGHDLVADSRLVMQLPTVAAQTSTLIEPPCSSLLVASDRTVICGSVSSSDKSGEEVCSQGPSFASYSLVTGKQLKVLYRYQGECLYGVIEPLWTDPTGSHVIAFIRLALKGKPSSTPAGHLFGLVTDGRFTPFPVLVTGTGFASGPADDLGGIAF